MTNELDRIVNNGLLLDSLSFTVLYIGDQFSFYFYSRTEKINKCFVGNLSQFCHCWKIELQIQKGKARVTNNMLGCRI